MSSSIIIERGWGHEEVIVNGVYCVKLLYVRPNFQSSLHYHRVKDETFIGFQGEGILETYESGVVDRHPTFHILHSDGPAKVFAHIPPTMPHRFWSKKGCIIIEASTHHDDADVARIEPSHQIVGPDPREKFRGTLEDIRA